MPAERLDVPIVSADCPLTCAFQVPNFNQRVIGACGKSRIHWRERDGPHSIMLAIFTLVRLELVDGRHRWQPKFDHAGLVAAQQKFLIVAPGHATYGPVVSRHESFEIKGNAVPEGKFATCRSCNDTPPLGRPSENIDRRLILIDRGMAVPCANARGCLLYTSPSPRD